jgi:hypothetical protein
VWPILVRVSSAAMADQRDPGDHFELSLVAGPLHFSARGEAAAPRTVEAFRRLLPLRDRLIHVRWSGEATWIPLGEVNLGVGYENQTSHPAPGEILLYTGSASEREILLPYGACDFSSRVGQLAGNHLATVVPEAGETYEQLRERLRELGRRCLWEGAQEIAIAER